MKVESSGEIGERTVESREHNQTSRSRVLHRNGGLNLGKPRVCSCLAPLVLRRDLIGRLAFNPVQELRSIGTTKSDSLEGENRRDPGGISALGQARSH